MRAFRDNFDPGRLALALLLALGLHAALLFGVSVHWRPSSFQRSAPPFEVRLALPKPGPMAAPPETALMEWLPPAPPKPFLSEATVLEPAPKPSKEPAVKPAPPLPPAVKPLSSPNEPATKPAPPPAVKPIPKPPPVIGKPTPKPAIRPTRNPVVESRPRPDAPPPPKPPTTTKPAAPPVIHRSEGAEQRRSSAAAAPGRLSSTALLGQIAGLEAEQQRQESASVRAKRVNLTDTQSAAGFYAADWARKVTRVGEMNFPDAARRLKTSAGPLLEVAIRADGRLQEVRLIRSSGNAELDQAARRIVELAAPYPPFSPELRQAVDLLRIEAPWRFDPGGRVRAR